MRVLSQSLRCATNDIWVVSEPLRADATPGELILSTSSTKVRLRRSDGSGLFFEATQSFVIVPDSRAKGTWKASTRSYVYSVFGSSEPGAKPELSWHWHPNSSRVKDPHLHVYSPVDVCGQPISDLHIPGDRVAFENVVRFLFVEMHVVPRRDDWEAIVDAALENFIRYRTWPRSSPIELP